MARYRDTDASRAPDGQGDGATGHPTERQQLETAAAREGKALSDYVRQLCLRRGGKTPVVAGDPAQPRRKGYWRTSCAPSATT